MRRTRAMVLWVAVMAGGCGSRSAAARADVGARPAVAHEAPAAAPVEAHPAESASTQPADPPPGGARGGGVCRRVLLVPGGRV